MRQKLRKRESLGDDHTAPGLGTELKRKEGNQGSIVAHACHPRLQMVEAGALGAQSDSLLHTWTVGGHLKKQRVRQWWCAPLIPAETEAVRSRQAWST